MAFGKNKKKQANKLEIDEARARRQAERPRKGGASIIELRDVSKVYSGGHLAVDRVSLAIGRDEFVFLVGPATSASSPTRRFPSSGATSAPSSRTSSCSPAATSTTTSPMRSR